MPQSSFTPKQGQYLAFIHLYTKLHREGPSQLDIQKFFRVTPPTVHNMLVRLEERGLVARTPRAARSVRVLVDPADLPELE